MINFVMSCTYLYPLYKTVSSGYSKVKGWQSKDQWNLLRKRSSERLWFGKLQKHTLKHINQINFFFNVFKTLKKKLKEEVERVEKYVEDNETLKTKYGW